MPLSDALLSPLGDVLDHPVRADSLLSLTADASPVLVLEANNLDSMWQENTQATKVSADGDTVGYWADLSGNGNDLTQATAASRPLYKVIDGYPCVQADGVNDYLGPALFSISQPYWRISVIQQVSWQNQDRIFGGGNAARGILFQNGTTPDIGLFDGVAAANNSDATIGTRIITTEIRNGASSSIQVNNGTAATGNPGGTAPGGITLFANHTNANWANVRIYATVMGAGSAPANLAEIKSYLSNVYGVSL